MRIAVTIAESAPGAGDWKVIDGPGSNVQEQKDNLKALCAEGGDCRAMILTQSGQIKRGRIGGPKPKASKKKAASKD